MMIDKENAMNDKLRVLGIAPYEGLRNLMMQLVRDYPGIELTTYLGDLEKGLEIAKQNFHKNYDAVISRGMTAQLLHQLPIPVIEVSISMHDILSTFRLAGCGDKKTAIISFANIASIARQLCQLIDYDIDIYTVASAEKIEELLMRCRKNNYDIVLCDAVVNETARRLGMNSFLITSGVESMREAFDQVIRTCENIRSLRSENKMLRELVNGQISQTILFDSSGNIILSTVEEPSQELITMLRDEIDETIRHGERHMTKLRNGRIYSIRATTVDTYDKRYTVFFFTERRNTLPTEKSGISFHSFAEAESEYHTSLLFFSGELSKMRANILRMQKTDAPILISGEEGTGKESLVDYLYINGHRKNASLIRIDCYLLNDKSWDFLYRHQLSPLFENGNSLYLKNIDRISPQRSQKLLSTLKSLDTAANNQIYMSTTQGRTTQSGEIAASISAMVITVPPLRELKESIPDMISRTLDLIKNDLPHAIAGIDPDAVKIMQEYRWPGNFSQFKRAMRELATTSSGPFITAEEVNAVLEKESYISFTSDSDDALRAFNLHRPLREIEGDIARRILKETGGNQTETASILKISRTTLWRMLKEQKETPPDKSP